MAVVVCGHGTTAYHSTSLLLALTLASRLNGGIVADSIDFDIAIPTPRISKEVDATAGSTINPAAAKKSIYRFCAGESDVVVSILTAGGVECGADLARL